MCGVKDKMVSHLLCECSKMHKCNTVQAPAGDMTMLPGLCTGQSRNSMDLMSQINGMSISQNWLSKLLP